MADETQKFDIINVTAAYTSKLPDLRWVAPSPSALATQPTTRRLQQRILFKSTDETLTPSHHEWVDIPTVYESDPNFSDNA